MENKMSIRTWLEPSELDHQYSDRLLKKIRTEWEGKCDERYGMIVRVVKIDRVVRQCVMEIIPGVTFMLDVIIDTYLPQIGDTMQVCVDKILSHGVFAHPFPKIRVFIPMVYHSQYKYLKDFTNSYLEKSAEDHTNLPKRIHINDALTIILREIRFEKDAYSCLASIESI